MVVFKVLSLFWRTRTSDITTLGLSQIRNGCRVSRKDGRLNTQKYDRNESSWQLSASEREFKKIVTVPKVQRTACRAGYFTKCILQRKTQHDVSFFCSHGSLILILQLRFRKLLIPASNSVFSYFHKH